jgi:hypothetical protein
LAVRWYSALLLVGDELDGDQADEEACDGDLDGGHGGVQARDQEEEVGRCRNSEEEDLKELLARCWKHIRG